jgi:hypothetical protein
VPGCCRSRTRQLGIVLRRLAKERPGQREPVVVSSHAERYNHFGGHVSLRHPLIVFDSDDCLRLPAIANSSSIYKFEISSIFRKAYGPARNLISAASHRS